MFAYAVSATTLFMCCGHADPSTRELIVVSVINDAALAMLSPISHMRLMFG
jgi:hypothetical protein